MVKAKVEMTPPVHTGSGMLRGFYYNGVNIYRGIPYAHAARFESPEPAAWEGVRDCTSFGYVPPQVSPGAVDEELYIPHAFGVPGEDCLNLNIFTPVRKECAHLPVIVALFGSSFEGGSSIEMRAYDGENLARDGRVVFVSVNTRVNLMGFFDFSGFGEEYFNTGNRGFEDALCALTWVKENICAFGGDPDNVTLFGAVGGGLRIKYIMQCPAFKGLFHKVFNLSGVGDHGRPPESEEFYHLAQEMLKRGGYDENDVTPFKDMPYEKLFALYRETKEALHSRVRCRLSLNGWCYGRVEDEGVCPEMTDITVVCGATMMEQNFPASKMPDGRLPYEEAEQRSRARFGAAYEYLRREYLRLYPQADERDLPLFSSEYRDAVITYANALSENGMKVYTYLFAPEFPINGGIPAFHCSDIPYIMRYIHMVPAQDLGEQTADLMEAYSGALLSLACSGTPENALTGPWRPYTKEDPFCMCFSDPVGSLEDDQAFIEAMNDCPPAR